MSASEEIREVLERVAAGTVHPEQATAALCRWFVVAFQSVGNAGGIDVAKLVAEAAEQERAMCIKTVITTGDVPIYKLRKICDRIEARPLLQVSEGSSAKGNGHG